MKSRANGKDIPTLRVTSFTRNYVKKSAYLSCKPKVEMSKRSKMLLDVIGEEAYILIDDEMQGMECDFISIDEWREFDE